MFHKLVTASLFFTLSVTSGCDENEINERVPLNFLLSTEASSPDRLEVLKNKWFFCEKCLNNPNCLVNNVHECKKTTLPDREIALGKAINEGNAGAVYFLVDIAKTNINHFSGEYRYTPLMIAAYYGSNKHLEIAKFLISRGANINAVRNIKPNSTPLLIAIWKNNTIFVDFLLKEGANPSLTATGKKKDAACMIAIAHQRTEIIPMLEGCCDYILNNSKLMNDFGSECKK